MYPLGNGNDDVEKAFIVISRVFQVLNAIFISIPPRPRIQQGMTKQIVTWRRRLIVKLILPKRHNDLALLVRSPTNSNLGFSSKRRILGKLQQSLTSFIP